MKPIYAIDFCTLSAEEKVAFVRNLKKQLTISFQKQPFSVQLLTETLIFTRWWNAYKYMTPDRSAPPILETAVALLWDFQEGKCDLGTFARFQKSYSDCTLEILTGNDDELNDDPKSDAFYQEYFSQWDTKFYDIFLSNLDTVLTEALSHRITWDAVEGIIDRDIADHMIDLFENVYQKEAGGYHPSELDRREKEIYNTPTFARVIALLQEDIRTALDDLPLAELRIQYQNNYLFAPEDHA